MAARGLKWFKSLWQHPSTSAQDLCATKVAAHLQCDLFMHNAALCSQYQEMSPGEKKDSAYASVRDCVAVSLVNGAKGLIGGWLRQALFRRCFLRFKSEVKQDTHTHTCAHTHSS